MEELVIVSVIGLKGKERVMNVFDLENEISNRKEKISCDSGFLKFSENVKEVKNLLNSLVENLKPQKLLLEIIFENDKKYIGIDIPKSCINTLMSICACANLGNIADAYSLIRKFHEDIFMFLYFIKASKEPILPNEMISKNAKENTKKWIENRLENLYLRGINEYLRKDSSIISKLIPSDDYIKIIDQSIIYGKRTDVIEDIPISTNNYLIQKSMRDNDNNFIHTNGSAFAKINHSTLDSQYLENVFIRMFDELFYSISIFILLLIIIKPELLLNNSNDNKEEEEIEPYINSFIMNKIRIRLPNEFNLIQNSSELFGTKTKIII